MPPFHKNSIPTWFVENNQCCLHLNCRKHSVLRQYTTRELRKTISSILSLNLVTKHFIKSLLFIFNLFFNFFLRVFNLVQFPVWIVPVLFLQGTYLEAVSGLHCFIFLARLNMKEQVIIINCCNINFIIILISSEKKQQQQQQQNKQTRTSISVSIF